MKNNIKTFPKGYAYPKEYIKWKEAFESELREWKLWVEGKCPERFVGTWVEKHRISTVEVLSQILGEEYEK